MLIARAAGPGWGLPLAPARVVGITFGAWHPTFVSWIHRLLRDRAAAVALSEVEANGLLGGMLWRVAALLSVGAQWAIFLGISRCLPELRLGAGRLGRELSEEPEFGRAFPAGECVDWVADELGLVAGRWDGLEAGVGGPREGT